jgi:hypothetical protein
MLQVVSQKKSMQKRYKSYFKDWWWIYILTVECILPLTVYQGLLPEYSYQYSVACVPEKQMLEICFSLQTPVFTWILDYSVDLGLWFSDGFIHSFYIFFQLFLCEYEAAIPVSLEGVGTECLEVLFFITLSLFDLGSRNSI